MSKAQKHDTGKPRISLIPREALWGMAQAFTYGANKYGQWNYKNGIEYTRLADAAYRHLSQFMDGEDIDAESGNNHLYHALASIAMLLDMTKLHPEKDDRYKKPINSETMTQEKYFSNKVVPEMYDPSKTKVFDDYKLPCCRSAIEDGQCNCGVKNE